MAKSPNAPAAQARTRRLKASKKPRLEANACPAFNVEWRFLPPCAACARFTNATRVINHTRVTSRDLSKRYSCNIPMRIICATCPGTGHPPVISSWASRLKAIESPRARQGLGMLCHAALSFFMLSTAFWGDGLKKFSTGTSWLLAASLFLRKAQSRDSLGLCSWVPKACASSRAPWRSPPLRGPLSLPPSLAPFNTPFAQRLQSLHGALPKGMAV